MKNLKFIILSVILISLTTIIGCKSDSDDPASDTELRLSELENGGISWVLASNGVTKNGFDVSDQFSGFKLTINGFSFATENSLSGAWPASGTWEFVNNNPNLILRSDGVQITVDYSVSSLQLTFIGSGSSGGRSDSVDGEYQFHLVSE